jgi:hypothetical protein
MTPRPRATDEPRTEHGWLIVNRGGTLELRPTCSEEALIADWALENSVADDVELPRTWYPPDSFAKRPEWRGLPADLKRRARSFAQAAAAGHHFWEMSGWRRLPREARRVVRGISRNYWKLNQDEEARETDREHRRLRRSPIRHGKSSYSRQAIAERFGWRCAKCGRQVKTFHLDHRRPLSRGGRHTLRNI